MELKVLFILCYVNLLCYVHSAKILAVFPVPSISHQVVFRKLTLELANRGHDITVITPDPAFPNGSAPENLKEIDIHEISYKTYREGLQNSFKVKKDKLIFNDVRRSHKRLKELYKIQLQTPEVQEVLSNRTQKYDVILIEALYRPGLVFSHFFKAPVILISSLGAVFNNHQIMGSLTHPLLYPPMLRIRKYNMINKLEQLFNHYSVEYASYLNAAEENVLIRQIFGSEVPPLGELYNNVDMLFLNLNPIWAENQPVPPNVIYMGGIHLTPQKELPNDLKTFLDSSKHGIIYFSLGSNIISGMIPIDKIQIMVTVLSSLPYDVLWKWDQDDLPGKSDNIKLSKWFPQADLLMHKNIKLFITQAGLQSTDEAIIAGVPLVAIPMFADQWYNAEKYVKLGIGKYLEIENMTEENFKDAVENVIKDESYRQNILKLRQMMQDQPETPLERAVWWTEYVIRNGGAKQLRAASANMSYAQYFEVEFIILILSVALLVIILSLVLIVKLIKFLNNLRNINRVKSKIKELKVKKNNLLKIY